jgi:hypothetical protein
MGLNPTILRQAQAFAFSRPRCGYRASGLVLGSIPVFGPWKLNGNRPRHKNPANVQAAAD